MSKLKHESNEDVKCVYDIEWEFNHTLMLIIQKTTGKMTHEILNVVVNELEATTKAIGFDLDSKKSGATWQSNSWHNSGNKYWSAYSTKRRNKIVTYPGTDIVFNLVITVTYCAYKSDRGKWIDGKHVSRPVPENCNHVTVKVTLPNKTLKFSTSDMNMILAEADILDESSDLEDVELKSSPTLEEKKLRRQAKQKQTR